MPTYRGEMWLHCQVVLYGVEAVPQLHGAVRGLFSSAVEDTTIGIFTTIDKDESLQDWDPDLETLIPGSFTSSSPTAYIAEAEALLKAKTFLAE